jgi:site-specific DNA-methyltransferase (cytosine-N4-specific)
LAVKKVRVPTPAFQSGLGKFYVGDSEALLSGPLARGLSGKVQLLLTSPPFPLNTKKRYGNKRGDDYKEWFCRLFGTFSTLLADKGSLVIELGNAWEPGRPVQSLLHLECLLELVKDPRWGLRLCQQFICYNPTRLPSPAQWVTIERTRLTDSFTHVWWLSKSDYPKADNRKVLRPYSESMISLLKRKTYNHGLRPSQHRISKTGFLKDHGGSIGHNFFELHALTDGAPRLPNVMRLPNTRSTEAFLDNCRSAGIKPHPARMQMELANFFISFLTDKRDLVLDPFAGSNTTGYAAEFLGRKWVATEINRDYAKQAKLRFKVPKTSLYREAAE